ncbi:S8 family peptidase [Fictibacillus sp. BK138]|uniref:S8 family peptidase n=1 Tax=Fictibacillus sp. BK138 TaxID=2512121 RepID=UPI00102A8E68|nr:S8 family serine peptidase [Fictibacillus sp. BK138]RZT21532.1 subtilisin [Fictibacillus sp. BK138]
MLNFKSKIGVFFFSASLLTTTIIPSEQTYANYSEDQHKEYSYIIGFIDKINKSLIIEHGGVVTTELESINAVSATLTVEAAQHLRTSKLIRFLEVDKKVEAEEQYISPYLQELNFPQIQSLQSNSFYSGKGIKVGVLDTGIDIDHPDLKIAGGVSFVPETASYDDQNGHGTHVAGIIGAQDNLFGIKGLAPDADIYAIKVLNKDGVGQHSQIIKGLEWATQNNLDIVNLSLAGEDGSYALKLAVDEAYKKGLFIVAASGNLINDTFSNQQFVYYPAKYESVIAVGAVDQNNNHPYFSGSGPELELVAPGVNIFSTYKNESYEFLTGTSMATPFVTAIYALYQEAYPNLSTYELRTKIQKHAKDLGPIGRDNQFGYGLIQAPELMTQPGFPYKLHYQLTSDAHIALSWESPFTGSSIVGFNVYRDGKKVVNLTKSKKIKEQLKPGFYLYEVTAVNENGIESEKAAIMAKVYQQFPDFTATQWYAKYVYDLNARNALGGYPDGNFYPDKQITRGEAASMIGRVLKLDGTPRYTLFPDVKSSYFASGYIASMTQKSLISGYPDGKFKPSQTISRGEVIALLDRSFKLKTDLEKSKAFHDLSSNYFAFEAIKRYSSISIANGYEDGSFRPFNPVTRSEMAVLLSRTIEENLK